MFNSRANSVVQKSPSSVSAKPTFQGTVVDIQRSSFVTQESSFSSRVMAWQCPQVVARIARKCKLSAADSDQLFMEVKMFLLRSSTARQPLRPSKQVDAGWHEFLVFTREYRTFCQDVLGTFVDHCPDDAPGSFGAKADCKADCVSCWGQEHPDDKDDCSSKIDIARHQMLNS